jgi:hypothetical protein
LFRHCFAANFRSADGGADDLRRLWSMVVMSNDGRTALGQIAAVAIGSVFHHCSGHDRGKTPAQIAPLLASADNRREIE